MECTNSCCLQFELLDNGRKLFCQGGKISRLAVDFRPAVPPLFGYKRFIDFFTEIIDPVVDLVEGSLVDQRNYW